MMKIKNLWMILFSVFLLTQGIFGQEKENPGLIKARALMNNYRDASMFPGTLPGKTETSWESIFRDCFADDRSIIFDIPVKQNQTGHDASMKNTLPAGYLHFVSIDRYIQMVRAIYAKHNIRKIEYQFLETGVDISKLKSDSIIVFEIEKRFAETDWSNAASQKFLFTITIHKNGLAKISSIRLSDPGQGKNGVELVLDMDYKSKRKKLTDDFISDIIIRLKIDFDENIYDRTITQKFDSTGRINLGLLSNRAKIIIDTAYGVKNSEKFKVPQIWKENGIKVSPPPEGGFKVGLKPYIWNGYAFTLGMEGGGIIQSSNNLQQFSGGSGFNNNTGYSIGAGFSITKFYNPDNWINSKSNWIFGIGAGISFHYARFRISGTTFDQSPYAFSDRTGDTCLIHYSGSEFEETISMYLLKIPVFFEIRNKFLHSLLGMQSFSLQAGANLMIPFQGRYETSGTFSRMGEYPQYNGQIITEDDFYNYYTMRPLTYNSDIAYHTFMAEGMVKVNGFIPVSKQNPNNTMVLGLLVSFPFSASLSSETGKYQINTGDDIYHSLAFSKEKIYKFYFGISLGFNLIKYKVD
ncbi:MAG: hypothetical protein K9H16_15215 [Bacteroidales bacterium]|nr:hypothetical protein [Bacteroidales bacterium]